MTTIKVQFKGMTRLFSALCLLRSINSKVVILDNNTFMLDIPVNNVDQLEKLRNNDHVYNVDVYKNNVETIKGLFQSNV